MADSSAPGASRYPFLPGGPAPLEIARAEGCWLETPTGHRILDAAGGAIVASIGHGRAEVAEAVARALREVTYAVPPFATAHRQRLVERLQQRWLPGGLTRVMFTAGGSDAIDAAIRIARQHFVSKGEPGRVKVLGRALSYHGTTLSGLSVGGHERRRRAMGPLLHDWPKAPTCYPLRCAESAACREARRCDLACAEALERVVEREGPQTIAAFVFEPVGGSTAGALTPPEGYWPRVTELCRRHGILTIADEVMCGFGRTGKRFAVEHWGITPDLMVGGKGLAAGYAPIGGVYASEEVVAPIAARGDDVMFYTYAAHPASCAAADAVLEIVEREALVERARRMGELLRAKLARLEAHPNVAEVRGRGLLQALELVADRERREPFPSGAKLTGRVVAAGLAEGVFFYPGGCDPARDVICLGPPFIVEEADLDRIVQVLEKSIDSAVARV